MEDKGPLESKTPIARSHLVRVMGRWDLAAIGINQMIGSGIFVLPATVALLVGIGASPLVWMVAAVINGLIILCFAEASGYFTEAGGPYLYARTAFGRFVGFEVGWMIWLTRVTSQAALVNAFTIYFSFFLPAAGEGQGRLLVISLLILVLTGINLVGVRYGSWTVNFFTVAKMLPLAAFVGIGVFYVDWDYFEGLLNPRLQGFGEATLLLMFAYGGFELITLPAGEARSPRQDAPIALLTALSVVAAVFVLIQMVAVGTLPTLGETEHPLADAALLFMGAAGGLLVAVGGLVSIAGTNAGGMLAGPRVTFALAEKGQLPRFFAHVHPRFRTPDGSILFYAIIAWALALSGTFQELATMSSLARLFFYVTTCMSIPVLRRRMGHFGSFRVPGGYLIPALATFLSLALVVSADARSLRMAAGAFLVGALLFFLSPEQRTSV